ncbi:phosphoribosylanthranilate isomerase [Pelagibacterales bacterium SAG-MED16]|jgi:phosphoribosylanthranilate isomerase|nr:phosphoribosylanthranilate isomerase [Pelagibacterales bacterium SAG-MED16]|tara:strand:+ start:650 stop:1273 length:624 start_codon:yes stop_codon:yes gene_type:complete
MVKGIKICGVSDLETLNYIVNHQFPPKFVGFISNYKKSKRYVEYEKLKKLVNIKKKETSFVAVLVDPDNKILEQIKELSFDFYQLYDVSPEKTKIIKEKYNIKVITALTISSQKDVDIYKEYDEVSDLILFDGKGYEKSIGFNHELLNSIPNSINKMIAGNIKIEDIPKFKNKDYYIDLSGSLENEKGIKDLKKINKLLNLATKNET